jgi:hypothetical protein
VRGDEPHHTIGARVYEEHSGSLGVNLEKNPQSYIVDAVPMG